MKEKGNSIFVYEEEEKGHYNEKEKNLRSKGRLLSFITTLWRDFLGGDGTYEIKVGNYSKRKTFNRGDALRGKKGRKRILSGVREILNRGGGNVRGETISAFRDDEKNSQKTKVRVPYWGEGFRH